MYTAKNVNLHQILTTSCDVFSDLLKIQEMFLEINLSSGKRQP
jgi:hypothetical protein